MRRGCDSEGASRESRGWESEGERAPLLPLLLSGGTSRLLLPSDSSSSCLLLPCVRPSDSSSCLRLPSVLYPRTGRGRADGEAEARGGPKGQDSEEVEEGLLRSQRVRRALVPLEGAAEAEAEAAAWEKSFSPFLSSFPCRNLSLSLCLTCSRSAESRVTPLPLSLLKCSRSSSSSRGEKLLLPPSLPRRFVSLSLSHCLSCSRYGENRRPSVSLCLPP
mmetsp:Transcript_49828/g.98213  ORF Transcript_49828/g.98213 Transcript_49828/m.98213 type:complete len:219 (+) Transcript_49828:386-1042(+)